MGIADEEGEGEEDGKGSSSEAIEAAVQCLTHWI